MVTERSRVQFLALTVLRLLEKKSASDRRQIRWSAWTSWLTFGEIIDGKKGWENYILLKLFMIQHFYEHGSSSITIFKTESFELVVEINFHE